MIHKMDLPVTVDDRASLADLDAVLAGMAQLTGDERMMRLRSDQHARWQRGDRIPAEAYLARIAELRGDSAAAVDLIFSEILLRTDRGEQPSLQEYIDRFPSYEEALRRQIKLHEALQSMPQTMQGVGTIQELPGVSVQGVGAEFRKDAQPDSTTPPIPGIPGNAAPPNDYPPRISNLGLGQSPLQPQCRSEFIGKYRIIERLGSGGQGEVYRAVHPALGRDVVIKVARRAITGPQQQMLIEEGRILARLDDPGLVKVFDVDVDHNRPFVVFEYIAGRTLADIIQHELLPEKEVVALVADLAGIMDRLHRHGVVHRDLKPSNILIDAAGHARILDFGLSSLETAWDEINPAGPGMAGTLAYMSPEQAAGKTEHIGPRSDLFCLGGVLYHLLTGRPPYRAGSPQQVWQQALTARIQPPGELKPGIDRHLERVCLTALAADPAARYASGAEMQRALLAYSRRPYPRMAALCLLGLVLIAVIVIPLILRSWSHFSPGASDIYADAGYMIRQFEGHRGWVWGVAFAPDGLTALSCSGEDPGKEQPANADSGLRLWDVESGKQVRHLRTDKEAQLCIAICPDGKSAVSGGWNGDLHVWDLQGGREIASFRELHKERVHGVAITPDGSRVLSVSYDGSAVLWDIRTGIRLRRFKTSSKPMTHVALTSDGTRALASNDDQIAVWDVNAGTELSRKQADAWYVTSVSISVDGRHALSAGGKDGIQLWDLESMTKLRRLEGHENEVWRVVFSVDGRRALSGGSDRTVRLWDVERGVELSCLKGHTDHVFCVALSPDGRRALSSSKDGSVRLWQLPE
jgi:WD40 repeat protein/serine/threonine protein kinase